MQKQELLTFADNVFNDCMTILERKGSDYATNEDAFKNFKNSEMVGVPATKGVIIRMMDKMSRIANLIDNDPKVVDERFEDTIMDLINYAIILSAMKHESTIFHTSEETRPF